MTILVDEARKLSRQARKTGFPSKKWGFSAVFSCNLAVSVVIFASQKTPGFADSKGAAKAGVSF
jgi:hypothetical protein